MIRATVTIVDRIPELHRQVEQLARRATEAAAEAAAATAQATSSIDLELEVVPASEDSDGIAAGIRSQKKGARDTRIARFFDEGTLGNRRKTLKRPGRTSWTVKRPTGSYTAHRGDVSGKGIPAERFFLKARLAGRRAMAAVVHHGLR